VFIEPEVLATIHGYRQLASTDTEAGGFLSGYYSCNHIHVTHLTEPYPKDRRSRARFTRRDPRHIQAIKRWYHDSGYLVNVLGEWHTHPEPTPSPSEVDLSGWRTFTGARPDLATIFLICGQRDDWLGLYPTASVKGKAESYF